MPSLLPPSPGRSCPRRQLLSVVALLVLAGLPPPARAQPSHWQTDAWVGTWGASPAEPAPASKPPTFEGQTLRLIVHASLGGARVRIRVSNELGTTPLAIGEAHIALRRDGAGIAAGSDRRLTFGGLSAVTIPAGAPVLSDPVDLDLPARSDLAVSLYLPGTVAAGTLHASAFQTSYVSPAGNFAGAAAFPVAGTLRSWPFLTEVDVRAPGRAAIVALGDSITDSSLTTVDANHRWTDLLALRLQAAGAPVGVVNRGISGNRMLRDPGEQPLFGKAALARFDRDVLATAGVRYAIVLIGINDIGHPGTGTIPAADAPTVDDLIGGYRQLIARAHAKGIAVYGGTLTPFEDTRFAGYYTAEKEQLREALNRWIRGSREFDGVIDFERAVRDPDHPTRVLPAYDSGDHLHPNDLGMQAMADAIPLALFRDIVTRTSKGARVSRHRGRPLH